VREDDSIHPLKRLVVDTLMSAVFVLLLVAAAWIAWVFYVRGPVQLESRGFVSRTVMQEAVRPEDVERYTVRHFHNLDDASVAGIGYRSSCLACHGDYPHSESVKVRAFFNAHSWFIDCDVCHVRAPDEPGTAYRWISNASDAELTQLEGVAGNYGGRIARVRLENGVATRISDPAAETFTERYLRTKDDMDTERRTAAELRIHEQIADEPLSCDACHTQNGHLDFSALLYSSHDALNLQSIDVASMVKAYQEFHLPSLFDYRPPSE
jgi:hypothetical protein